MDTKRIRNVAIIAHIDHGKTTLIDSIFRAAHVFRENARVEERVMDSYDLERERGITIRAKHCSVEWDGYVINIVDTPGHADFSGEVERVLSMVDSVLLLVDAAEGPMPQTRYVLMRALRRGLRPIVIVNKVDREAADATETLHRTFDLFIELGTSDAQADFPVLYGSGLHGWFVRDFADEARTMAPLFETIIEHVPPPAVRLQAPFRMQVSTLAWSDYVGRIGCGRVVEGVHRSGEPLVQTLTRWKDPTRTHGWEVVGSNPQRSTHLWVTRGLERVEVEEVAAGDIVWIAGIDDISIGDTLSAPERVEPALPPLEIEEPTVSMFFLVNTGPFAGQEGSAITLRQLRDRLERELQVNVALRVEDVGRPDGVKVSGRGELHLAVLIEEIRREGIELCVSRPEVITMTDEDDGLLEPIEHLVIEVPQEHQGIVFEKVSRRRGELRDMTATGNGVVRLEFEIPTRGLLGYRTEFLTDTRGLGIMVSRFIGYGAWRGAVLARNRGSMVSIEMGEATTYSLESLQSRGTLFVSPMDAIYMGMIVGENARTEDLPCNPTKKKHLTNYRSSTREVDVGLKTPLRLSLDAALEWIADDELVEVTPRSIRLRKAILDEEQRKRAGKRLAAALT
ncbi:MAG: translational GTPase TypA [Gemmatimonadetes bacterium]|nr:translational GTPase TypA [Gemmatimonadota bacterium]